MTRDTSARFWSKVDKRSPKGCWDWTASLRPDGYGQFSLGTMVKANRASWLLSYGPIPQGLSVLHRCDNRRCVRPDHLFLGTQADNIRDMVAKGRRGRTGARGERNSGAVLNWLDVETIRERISGGQGVTDVAADFGVSRQTIWLIKSGRSWRRP